MLAAPGASHRAPPSTLFCVILPACGQDPPEDNVTRFDDIVRAWRTHRDEPPPAAVEVDRVLVRFVDDLMAYLGCTGWAYRREGDLAEPRSTEPYIKDDNEEEHGRRCVIEIAIPGIDRPAHGGAIEFDLRAWPYYDRVVLMAFDCEILVDPAAIDWGGALEEAFLELKQMAHDAAPAGSGYLI